MYRASGLEIIEVEHGHVMRQATCREQRALSDRSSPGKDHHGLLMEPFSNHRSQMPLVEFGHRTSIQKIDRG